MSWSWKVGEIRGIGLYIHFTFLILIAFLVFTHWSRGHDTLQTLQGIGFVLALFGCVVLHEFGHALMAARYGIQTRDITLLPIGGVARLERMPEDPWQELWVALAGPAVNVVIAALIGAWFFVQGTLLPLTSFDWGADGFLANLFAVNVSLVLFNLLPAFPMDGGRVLRAILATRLTYPQATQIAATVGQAMAVLFGFSGLMFNQPFLLFIALFVWIGAGQESSLVQVKSALFGLTAAAAMQRQFRVLTVTDSLQQAIDAILDGSQGDFPVVSNRGVEGMLTRSRLLVALAQLGVQAEVSKVMQSDLPVIDEHEPLEQAFEKLQQCECGALPVVRDGELVGLLTLENIGEFIAIRSALAGLQHSGEAKHNLVQRMGG